jgi:protein-tyrosine phosphatase
MEYSHTGSLVQSPAAVTPHGDSYPFTQARTHGWTAFENDALAAKTPSLTMAMQHHQTQGTQVRRASPQLSRNFDQISIRDGEASKVESSAQPSPAAIRASKQPVDTQALQDLLRHAMDSPHGSQTSSRQTASPTPSFGTHVVQIGPHELAKLLNENGPASGANSDVLLLDLRAIASFATSRVKGAINLGIPATLLKRSSYTVAKIAASVADSACKSRILAWQEARAVILYDNESFNVGEGTPLYQLARKFTNEDWHGQAYTVKGGFNGIANDTPELLDLQTIQPSEQSASSPTASTDKPRLTLKQLGNFSCALPAQKSAANPFFNNIRQNQDLIGGVGQPIPLQVPEASEMVKAKLPAWLRRIAYEPDGAKLVADRFLEIEREEQQRMQDVLGVGRSANTLDAQHTSRLDTKHSIAAALERGEKNRYNNIWPFENARVKLQDCTSGDYINASHLHLNGSDRRYIATQGPLPATTKDFWQLVWENNVRTIVMLTKEREGGQVKCHSYWSDAQEMHPFQLEVLSEESLQSQFAGSEHVPVTRRRFRLTHAKRPLAGERIVQHLQFTEWPDLHVVQPATILALVAETHLAEHLAASPAVKRRKSVSGSIMADRAEDERPVVAHCSAGCGRTGVFCTTDTVTQLVKEQIDAGDVSSEDDLIATAVRAFRDQRLSMVQTLRQFVLCYDAVLLFCLEYVKQQYGLT